MPEHLRQTTSIDLFKRSLKRFYLGRHRAQRIRDISVQWAIILLTYLLTYLEFLNGPNLSENFAHFTR